MNRCGSKRDCEEWSGAEGNLNQDSDCDNPDRVSIDNKNKVSNGSEMSKSEKK